MILGFCHNVKDICGLLQFYEAWNGSFFPMLRVNLLSYICKGQIGQEECQEH